MDAFKKNIEFLYSVRGIGYSELARMAGVKHTTVRDWHLKDVSDPSARSVQKLAKALGYTTDELLSSSIAEESETSDLKKYLNETIELLGLKEAIRRLLQRPEVERVDVPPEPIGKTVVLDGLPLPLKQPVRKNERPKNAKTPGGVGRKG